MKVPFNWEACIGKMVNMKTSGKWKVFKYLGMCVWFSTLPEIRIISASGVYKFSNFITWICRKMQQFNYCWLKRNESRKCWSLFFNFVLLLCEEKKMSCSARDILAFS